MNVAHIPDLVKYADGGGRCSMLAQDDKTCTIYADRPLVCRIDEIGSHLRLTREAWHFVNRISCVMLHEKIHRAVLEPVGSVCHHGKPTLPRTPTAPRPDTFPSLLDQSPEGSPAPVPEE